MEPPQTNVNEQIVNQTVRITRAYLSGNPLGPEALPALMRAVGDAVAALQRRESAPNGIRLPTCQEIRDSIEDRFLVSFEDGKRYHMLKRHLTKLGLTVEQYRSKWGLPKDYPMVAPYYTRKRARLAKRTRLGQYDRVTGKLPPSLPEPKSSEMKRRPDALAQVASAG